MPIYGKFDARSWNESFMGTGQRTAPKRKDYAWWLLHPEGFDPDKLDVNEFDQGDGRFIAKIPKNGERIRKTEDENHHCVNIELVIGRETDPETGEIHEETVKIGTSINGHLRGMMIAGENYHDYFDTNGFLFNDPMKEAENMPDERRETAPKGEAGEAESEKETDGIRPEAAQRLRERVAEELKEKNEVRLGGTTLVRLPEIPGIRILPPNQKGLSLVEYKEDQWYDPIKQQSRNRKRIIGQLSDEYPDAMVPNKGYYESFNIKTGLTWKEERKDGNDIEKAMQELRESVEERKKKKEEERLRTEEDERLKKLYGEDSPEMQEVAARRLKKMISEFHDQYDEKDRQDYIDMGVEDEYDKEDDGPGPVAENSDRKDPMSKENANSKKDDGKEDIQDLYNQVSKEKERTAILMRILESVTKTISNQAKKHPDHIINAYKARKINEILSELRGKYQGSGYEDLLELIQEPEEAEEDGRKYLTGMTYSDAEVLLSHYATIIEHIRLGKN